MLYLPHQPHQHQQQLSFRVYTLDKRNKRAGGKQAGVWQVGGQAGGRAGGRAGGLADEREGGLWRADERRDKLNREFSVYRLPAGISEQVEIGWRV